ncbi:hypothetical protein [Parabacteroides sp. PF5-9]|uniref:hypothetical protein n=1 Tax=Parabacteroides sp. PF5-9 TaxID=1742404 RepID=UPI002475E664|nr:hypothetical protein [Parabacteroides sp. PF5-9]MDH6358694.1 hypothetical protein [Parabacteroides sp. PF5-9]
MKRLIYIIVCLLSSITIYSQSQSLLTYKVNYDKNSLCNNVSLSLTGDLTVDWGDGQKEMFAGSMNRILLDHAYASDGEYLITLYGLPESITEFQACDAVQIISLELSANCKIAKLYGFNVTHLDISKADGLTDLNWTGSAVTSLDLSGHSNIEKVHLSGNPIAKDKVALLEMIESLPDRTGKEPGTLVIDMGDYPRHKAICERKNWVVQ